MTMCGVEISGSTAHLVVIDGTRDEYTVADVEPRKLSVNNSDSAADLKSFQAAIQAFVNERHIQRIAIKARAHRGRFAGGPNSFKIEAIIQLLTNCTVELISPVTISSILKKNPVAAPRHLKMYQHDAFNTAYACLHR